MNTAVIGGFPSLTDAFSVVCALHLNLEHPNATKSKLVPAKPISVALMTGKMYISIHGPAANARQRGPEFRYSLHMQNIDMYMCCGL